MTLKELQAFLWVIRLGSFSAAAKKLLTTQSTISTRVIELVASLVQKDLGAVTFAWMATPSLGVPTRMGSATQLEPFPIIMLSHQSNLHAILRNWFELAAASPRRMDGCNSVATVASLTMAGLGVRFLPLDYHREAIRSRRLKVIHTSAPIDPLNYVAAYRSGRPSSMVGPLSDLAASLSDFERRGIKKGKRRR